MDNIMYNKTMSRTEREFKSNRDPRTRQEFKSGGFSCAECKLFVPMNDEMGTRNRNHCPNCLWSKHMDNKPGDRKSDCFARMEPIALTLKQSGIDRYGREKTGELMIAHICTGCEKCSINRIAADDNTMKLGQLFNQSLTLATDMRNKLSENGVRILTEIDRTIVERQLYGVVNK